MLQKCYAGVRKPNGELYKPTTMNNFRFGFQRYFLNRLGFDIIKAPDFSLSNTCFKNMLRTIIKSGTGDINHCPEIEPEDVKKLYSSFLNSPTGLLEKVWFDIMFFLRRRGRENLRNMNKSTFLLVVMQPGTIPVLSFENIMSPWLKRKTVLQRRVRI